MVGRWGFVGRGHSGMPCFPRRRSPNFLADGPAVVFACDEARPETPDE